MVQRSIIFVWSMTDEGAILIDTLSKPLYHDGAIDHQIASVILYFVIWVRRGSAGPE